MYTKIQKALIRTFHTRFFTAKKTYVNSQSTRRQIYSKGDFVLKYKIPVLNLRFKHFWYTIINLSQKYILQLPGYFIYSKDELISNLEDSYYICGCWGVLKCSFVKP